MTFGFIRGLFLFFSLMPLVFAKNISGITIPLHYYPQYGIYTATVEVGKKTSKQSKPLWTQAAQTWCLRQMNPIVPVAKKH
ncbi:hypothetical protein Loa_01042 [Legionella oakridgensis ATCC 33761 = DSM 21215]|uniref:Uncharacterized protein n=1 Tax=Legionella oakridgensis ATCC 33761 = DSM 21215 TaxID=1268635 RepID=W0B7T2_9GAMM|nr:hypothetical protein [Legionella oakridgensis]AHE66598.1 hypothetical protein Loa_01042 [Legionella oakridgensis ATCC 33761 = DSM 21215]